MARYPLTRTKRITYGAITIFLSLLLSFVAIEMLLRLTSFPSGTGTGKAAQRWHQENWKPINSLGYRDVEFDGSSANPQIAFLGDSFTAGAGVKFEETYADIVRKRLSGIQF